MKQDSMSKELLDRLNGQPRKIDFSIVLLFLFAGVLSTTYTLIALRKYEMHLGVNHVITTLVSGACLGLMLVTALWFYERLESWGTALLLVAIMAVANCTFLFTNIAQSLQPEMEKISNPSDTLEADQLVNILFFFVTCLIAYSGFALILLRIRNAARTLLVAVASAVAATLALAFLVEHLRTGFLMNVFSADGMDLLWQLTLVSFLGLSLWIGQIVIRNDQPAAEPTAVSGFRFTRNGFISIGLVVVLFIGVQIWTKAVMREVRKQNLNTRHLKVLQRKSDGKMALIEAP